MGHGFGIVKEFTKETFGGLGTAVGYDSSMEAVEKYKTKKVIQADDAETALWYKDGKSPIQGRSIGEHIAISYGKDGSVVKGSQNPAFTEVTYDFKGPKSPGRYALNKAKGFGKDIGKGALFSGAMYGLSAFATDNADNEASDRMTNVAKHGAAFAADVAGDAVLTGIGTALGTFGGAYGKMAQGAITAFNFGSNLLGIDAGSMMMRTWDYAEEQYYKAKEGPKFDMTGNKSQAMQRQIQNLHASGSNLGEMMHN